MLCRSSVLIHLLASFLTCLFWGGLASCDSSSESQSGFQLTGSFSLCHAMDSISLYAVDGLSLKQIISVPLVKSKDEARFVMRGNVPTKGMYLLGKAPDNLMSLIVGDEQDMQISGDCENLRQWGKISGSKANDDLAQVNLWLARMGHADSSLQEKQALMDSLIPVNPLLARRVGLELIDPFDLKHNPVNFRDSTFAGVPLLSEYIHIYVQKIIRSAPSQEMAEQSLDQFLLQMVDGSPTHKNSLAAMIQSLDRLHSPAVLKYGQMYLERYELLDQRKKAYLTSRMQHYQEQIEAESRLSLGATAPTIELPTPTGSLLSLADLRGKVILLSFWASWSEASRSAHSWMKQLYQTYKRQGFEIMEVSIDQSQEAWIQAIDQDRRDWYHVADLRPSEGSAYKRYHIQSIPMTFLLDRNGKIIGKNLQRSTLEVKLAELFQN